MSTGIINVEKILEIGKEYEKLALKLIEEDKKRYKVLKWARRHGFTKDEVKQLMKEYPEIFSYFEDWPQDVDPYEFRDKL